MIGGGFGNSCNFAREKWNDMRYDYLIVGSGLYGATAAYCLHRQGKQCLVIEKRPHVGGNLYCEQIEGIPVHKYGAHIFHTSNQKVWNFVNGLVEFNRFINAPLANYRGKLYNLPFNMNTFCQIWPDLRTPVEVESRIHQQREEALVRLGGKEPQNLEEQALLLVGRTIYERLIKDYTEKQWGRKCTELPAFIIKRLPIRLTFDNNYFNDRYQGIPVGGYNGLIARLLKGVACETQTDFFHTNYRDWRAHADRLIYTGPLDQYFGYSLGKLDWRTVLFRTRVEHIPNYQGNAVINYTSHEVPYTRVIEHKHFDCFGDEVYASPMTVVSEEFPLEYEEGMEPYYPINDAENNRLAEQYRLLAEQESDVHFGGRLAEYRYYDMAPIVEKALNQFGYE